MATRKSKKQQAAEDAYAELSPGPHVKYCNMYIDGNGFVAGGRFVDHPSELEEHNNRMDEMGFLYDDLNGCRVGVAQVLFAVTKDVQEEGE